jgi:hypothetical protein
VPHRFSQIDQKKFSLKIYLDWKTGKACSRRLEVDRGIRRRPGAAIRFAPDPPEPGFDYAVGHLFLLLLLGGRKKHPSAKACRAGKPPLISHLFTLRCRRKTQGEHILSPKPASLAPDRLWVFLLYCIVFVKRSFTFTKS